MAPSETDPLLGNNPDDAHSTTSSNSNNDEHFFSGAEHELASVEKGRTSAWGYLGRAFSATAFFKIWPSLLFVGLWATGVVLLNKHTSWALHFPNTMLTVLGIMLGLAINYRVSTAYATYRAGRVHWSKITLGARNWARVVWLHCPESTQNVDWVPPDEAAKAADHARGVLEKKTMVTMALAFAVATKHHLRHEHGIYYEDLYYLVNFLPSLASDPADKPVALAPLPPLPAAPGASASPAPQPKKRKPVLHKAENPGLHAQPSWLKRVVKKIFQDGFKGTRAARKKAELGVLGLIAAGVLAFLRTICCVQHDDAPDPEVGTQSVDGGSGTGAGAGAGAAVVAGAAVATATVKAGKKGKKDKDKSKGAATSQPATPAAPSASTASANGVVASTQKTHTNVPFEITLFMSSYVAALQQRGVKPNNTTSQLFNALSSLSAALADLESIVSTPIPWSYATHLGEVTWIYCLLLPFQLYDSGFGWGTIAATVVSTYLIMGYASIAAEIENPFGYELNDLNLGHYTRAIAHELDEVTAWVPSSPDPLVFVNANHVFGPAEPGADELAGEGVDGLRKRLGAHA